MRRIWLFVLLTLLSVFTTSCREAPKVASRPPAEAEAPQAPPPVTTLRAVPAESGSAQPGEVLTSHDMERLQRERADMIARPSPLGEETDAAAEMQQKAIHDARESVERTTEAAAAAEGG